jgi:Kdo2-lipid IVA lauroyltransferase/acyltransferase
MKKAQYLIEGFGFWLICRIFKGLGPWRASAFGGWLLRTLGPRFPVHQIALKNLSTVFPNHTNAQNQVISHKMWENWGRVAAEYCHLPYFQKNVENIQIYGQEVIHELKQNKTGALFFSAHFSHFQMISIAAERLGLSLSQFSRLSKNPYVYRGMHFFQSQVTKKVLIKNDVGTLQMARALKKKEHILILTDQKAQKGANIPLLGHLCETGFFAARFAQKFHCPLIPVFVRRCIDHPLHFEVHFFPPLNLMQSEEELLTEMNQKIGQWIVGNPEEWLWVHKRWPFSQ